MLHSSSILWRSSSNSTITSAFNHRTSSTTIRTVGSRRSINNDNNQCNDDEIDSSAESVNDDDADDDRMKCELDTIMSSVDTGRRHLLTVPNVNQLRRDHWRNRRMARYRTSNGAIENTQV